MSRPSRTPLLVLLTLVSFSVVGCSGRTMYTAMYSPGRSYYVAPPEKKDTTPEPSAEALLQQATPSMPPPAPFSSPPEPGFPTMPAATSPAAEAPAAAPDASGMPGMTPTIPGL